MFTHFFLTLICPLAYGDFFFLTNDTANCKQEDCHSCDLEGFCSRVNSQELLLERRKIEERELTFSGVCSMLDL